MDGKDGSNDKGARHGQAAQQPPDEGRIGEVEQEIDGVVAKGGQPPDHVLQPEGGVGERPVVALVSDVCRGKPDAEQTGRGVERRLFREGNVIPDEITEEGGEVAEKDQRCQNQQPVTGLDLTKPTQNAALLLRRG